MTDRARVNLYSRLNALGRKPEEAAERLPWLDFQKEIVNQAEKLVPVMRPQRTPSGELHNQTLYSVWRRNEGGWLRPIFAAGGMVRRSPGADRPLWRRGSRQAITKLFPEKGLDRRSGRGGGRQHHRSGVQGPACAASPSAIASAWRRRAGATSTRGGRAESARAPSNASTPGHGRPATHGFRVGRAWERTVGTSRRGTAGRQSLLPHPRDRRTLVGNPNPSHRRCLGGDILPLPAGGTVNCSPAYRRSHRTEN